MRHNKERILKSHSRKTTPWENKQGVLNIDATPTQEFIYNRYHQDYNQRHSKISEICESAPLNSIKVKYCPRCGSINIVKNGFYKTGYQRFRCKDCKRNFMILTNTLYENHKINLYEQLLLMLNIFGMNSFKMTSKIQRNSETTTKYRFEKLYLSTKNSYEAIKLSGTVYLDEMYYSVSNKSMNIKKDGKLYRGLSRNKLCICVATDTKHTLARFVGFGKPNADKIAAAFSENIKEKSQIFHDEEKAHNQLIGELKLKSKSYNSKELIKLNDNENPIQPVNDMINLLRQFLDAHKGFNRDNIEKYLSIFSYFMSSSEKQKLQIADDVMNNIITAKSMKKTLKFRDFYSNKA